ncbi:MAG: hypothetical protein K5657_07890 [Desulfovibrio sp.]|nr:hypothetical protein [Desulfovibrio sp.]
MTTRFATGTVCTISIPDTSIPQFFSLLLPLIVTDQRHVIPGDGINNVPCCGVSPRIRILRLALGKLCGDMGVGIEGV